MPRRRRRQNPIQDIPEKANRILNIILVALVLIVVRVWHLSVVQHEERLEESRKPQKKLVVEAAKRGTIRDRFNIPLAINKVQYNAAIVYSQIRQIPAIKWEIQNGEKVKRYRRKEYILELSRLLSDSLKMDPERIEDLIYSKAALYNNLPYILKEDIAEEEYYRLKALEKDWAGIQMQKLPRRYYPMGKVAGDIIGYMGSISREQYEAIIQEIASLERMIQDVEEGNEVVLPAGFVSLEQAQKRLQELIEHAYTLNDYVGKTGIEGRFEEQLRGYQGRKKYFSDAKGNLLKEFPEAKPPLSGDRILLTISSELQEYAETLLIQNERIRTPRVTMLEDRDQKKMAKKQPWIKGGAIVAMDPWTGELLALASHPRLDPNDFINSGNSEFKKQKGANIRRWFETEEYVGEIWNGKRPMDRERHNSDREALEEESLPLTWESYLEIVLAEKSAVREGVRSLQTVGKAIKLLKNIERLTTLTGNSELCAIFNLLYPEKPYGARLPAVDQENLEEAFQKNTKEIKSVKQSLDPVIGKLASNYDKVLLVDLARLAVDKDRFPDVLPPFFEALTLSEYRNLNNSWLALEETVRLMTKDLYHEFTFKPWREANQKAFLKQKREEEKAAGKKYANPYLDLLDKQENLLFAAFWEESKRSLIQCLLKGQWDPSRKELVPYYRHFISWQKELEQGAHQDISWRQVYETFQKGVSRFSYEDSLALMGTFRGFNELNRALYGRYRSLKREGYLQLEKHLAQAFYPRFGFGYGRSYAYRQAATQGSIFKIITAYEALVQKLNTKNPHIKSFSLLNPLVITDDAHKKGKAVYVGYDVKGVPIPQLYKGGRLPKSSKSGIGKVDLMKAFVVSSNPYFSLLAADHLEKPSDLTDAAKKFYYGKRTGIDLPGEIAGNVPCDLDCNRNGLYAMAIGQHSLVVTPLQTAVMLSAIANGGKVLKPGIVKMIVGKEGDLAFRDDGSLNTKIQVTPTRINQEIFMPQVVRELLLNAMQKVVDKSQLSAWGTLASMYKDYPEAISDMIELKDQLVGKSSTAESVEYVDLDLETGRNIYNHTWFGGIAYDPQEKSSQTYVIKDRYGVPELIVVVYLRYGAWGKDTLPLAAQVAQKWRDIKKGH